MKILLTGCTAQQVNPQSHRKAANFSGLLWDALRGDERNEVFWQEPSVEMATQDLRKFDQVIVGIAPITALGANRAYGAYSIIERLWDDKKLKLLIDAPDPIKMQTASRSIIDHPENLTKDFFSYRKEFRLAKQPEIAARIVNGVNLLVNGTWPTTIVPGLPWKSSRSVEMQLPLGAVGRVQTLNLDYQLFDRWDNPDALTSTRRDEWALEKGTLTYWADRLNVSLPKRELPRTFRVETDTAAVDQLSESIGCLIGPSRAGTWWNTRYAQALSQRAAVFTDWHDSQYLGAAWMQLPGPFEMMDESGRVKLVQEQYEEYRDTTPNHETAMARITELLGSKKLTRRSA